MIKENKDFHIDEALGRLEEINNKLSDKNASLDESIKLYNEGSELAKKCYCVKILSDRSFLWKRMIVVNGTIKIT